MQASSPAIQWTNRALFRLAWPLVLEQLLTVAMGMSDIVMVSSAGESAVSGVSLVDAINILFITAFTALGAGGAVVCSQYLGRRQAENASAAARQLVYVAAAVSLVLAALAFFFRQGILSLIYGHIDADVMQSAETYLWFSALGYPFVALYNAGTASFRSMGNSRVSMLVALAVNILHIGLNRLFIHGFGWGVAGAGMSTLLCRGLAAVAIITLLLIQKNAPITLAGLHKVRLLPPLIRSILHIGVPTGLENSMFQIGKLLVARIVSTFGTSAIAGNAFAQTTGMLSILPGMAFGMAALTVVGQCVGAGDYDGVRRNTKKLMLAAHVTLLVISAALLAMNPVLLRMFNLSPEATELGRVLLFIYLLPAPLFWVPSFALPNALRAVGDARFPLIISVLSMWVFRIASAYLLAYTFGFGVVGVWIAMLLDWLVRGGFFVWRWQRGNWKKYSTG